MLNNDKIQSLLDSFFGTVIDKLDFDLVNNKISLRLDMNGRKTTYREIEFTDVWAHYYIKDPASLEVDFSETGYLQLAAIEYYPKGIGSIKCHSKIDEWFNQVSSNANFALDIWESLLLIEARSIKINQEFFVLENIN
ncbi:hypothetical protein MUG87_18530 [Ectobacillus sp. JY-23]|uniref:YxiG family protein n=1 Tax=Ectobacillus sp. JY-23 TaxID=2933872 RepID=UPI001FF41C70|nr:hypothetical protein [Ectobacillus sp. JY-23]UOY92394.1 hypothetical protein MUG87_18530 [Ectobacillus sp. JY-23]